MERQPVWPIWLERHIRRVTGPEDEPDTGVNGDPDSMLGEDDESGFDDMPVEVGWEDGWDGEDDDDLDEDEESC